MAESAAEICAALRNNGAKSAMNIQEIAKFRGNSEGKDFPKNAPAKVERYQVGITGAAAPKKKRMRACKVIWGSVSNC